jgi:hypothetical protein
LNPELTVTFKQYKAKGFCALYEHIDIEVNARDEDGSTAPSIACQNGRTKVVEMLLACDGVEANREMGECP